MADANTEITADSDQQIAPDISKPMTEREGASSIADLLDNDPSILDPVDDKEDKAGRASKPKEDEEVDPLGDDEDVEDKAGDDKEDGSPEKATAGKYVSEKAKYKLADGTEITVGELARNNLFQRDYSVKTEEVSRERAAITKEKADVAQLSKTLSEEREYVIWFAQKHAPKQPTPPTLSAIEDPMAHLQFQADLRAYQEFAESYRQFKTAADEDVGRQKGETQKQANERASKEVATLFERVKIDPKDSAKAAAFFTAIEKGASEFYGLNADQIATLAKQDHRTILVLRDAIRARQNKKAAPNVQEKLKAVPKMLRAPTARQAPDQQAGKVRAQTGERLRQTGSFEDGVAAIGALLSQ